MQKVQPFAKVFSSKTHLSVQKTRFFLSVGQMRDGLSSISNRFLGKKTKEHRKHRDPKPIPIFYYPPFLFGHWRLKTGLLTGKRRRRVKMRSLTTTMNWKENVFFFLLKQAKGKETSFRFLKFKTKLKSVPILPDYANNRQRDHDHSSETHGIPEYKNQT